MLYAPRVKRFQPLIFVALATSFSPTIAATLTSNDWLKINFSVADQLSGSPNTLLLVLGNVTIAEPLVSRQAALFDGAELIGEDHDFRFGTSTGGLSLVPSNAWKTVGSPYVAGTPTPGLDAIFALTNEARIAFTIQSGEMNIDLGQVRLEFLSATSCCGGVAITPAPTISSIAIFPRRPGDYNLDGDVTADDYELWRSTYGETSTLLADGNANGFVDAADYAVWRNHRGSSASTRITAAVPEPDSNIPGIVVICLALVSSAQFRRRPRQDYFPNNATSSCARCTYTFSDMAN